MIHQRLILRCAIAAAGALTFFTLAVANTPGVASDKASPSREATCTALIQQFDASPRDLLSALDGRAQFLVPLGRTIGADALVRHGLASEEDGDLAGALADYSRAIDSDPAFAAAYVTRAHVRNAMGDVAGAVADYDEALARGVDDADAYTLRGQAHASLANSAAALADFDAALAKTAGFVPALCGRALVLQSIGEVDRARAAFEAAIPAAPAVAGPTIKRTGMLIATWPLNAASFGVAKRFRSDMRVAL